jgi:hypothetical protein
MANQYPANMIRTAASLTLFPPDKKIKEAIR